jgi:hypothetical protein
MDKRIIVRAFLEIKNGEQVKAITLVDSKTKEETVISSKDAKQLLQDLAEITKFDI